MEKYFKQKDIKNIIKREDELYAKSDSDIRTEFHRDYNRILHSNAYRRLKHKTQVFFNIDNDHVCTRIEHVNHVDSVSYTIAKGLNLDTELTRAIACGHDLGHAPFGHEGETVLNGLLKNNLNTDYIVTHFPGVDVTKDKLFWHEKNGVRFVDDIELLPDPVGRMLNLNLTYAVRDGIISHCGEVDENALRPRIEMIDLKEFVKPGQYSPYTWEGCVVKVSDKIAYLGRDIEDAISLNFIGTKEIAELKRLSLKYTQYETLNTTGLMHSLIGDIIDNSSEENGICLSGDKLELLNVVKKFNYDYIYGSKLFHVYKKYVGMVLESIFEVLREMYDGENTLHNIENMFQKRYKKLSKYFSDWLCKYCDKEVVEKYDKNILSKYSIFENRKLYGDLSCEDDYIIAIVDFISGMTDQFAIEMFNELLDFSDNY